MINVANAQSFTTISLNIRYDNPADGVNNWHQRKVELTDFLIHQQPLFVGVQEALYHQVQFMDSVMKNYTYLGVGRDDGKLAGEFAPVFYDSTRVKLLSANTIWLSETTDTVSIGWDAALPRICSYGLFEIKSTQQKIWVFNTHFDHMGEIARAESARVLLNQIATENKSQYPVILMGDFNCTEKSLPIQYILTQFKNAKLVATLPFEGITGTFNAFDKGSGPADRAGLSGTSGLGRCTLHSDAACGRALAPDIAADQPCVVVEAGLAAHPPHAPDCRPQGRRTAG